MDDLGFQDARIAVSGMGTSPGAAGPVQLTRDEAVARALAHHRAGRLAEAVRLYEAVLASNPRDADALHLLGVTEDAQGHPARGAELITQALAIRETPSFRSNLGMVLGHLGRHEEAVACYERALVLRPDYPEALNNLGVSLEALHRHQEAEAAYRRAVAARPGYAEALGNLGNTLRSLGRLDEAVAAYEQAVAHNPAAPRASLGHALRSLGRTKDAETAFRHELAAHPDSPEALNNLAAALGEAGQPGEAATLLPQAVGLNPNYPEAHANLGQVLQQLGRLEEAVAACERALALRPDYPEALVNLGNALRGLDRLADSEAALRRALALRPTDVGNYNNLAITLQGQHRPHEALAVLDLAAALDPEDAETRYHRAMLMLRGGRFAEGWADYEWRFRTKQAGNSHAQFMGATPWRGEAVAGRTVLLVPEQGFGDTIQFARYAPLVAARGARVILGVQPALIRLLRGLHGVDQIVTVGDALPPYDLHCPLLSLPRVFKTALGSVPASVPYLFPEPEAAARWAVRLQPDLPGLRVGVVWGGNPQHLGDRQRSLPFTALAPLWSVPGVRWFSLQVGDRAAALRDMPAASLPPGGIEDLAPELTDFAETAAALAGLDLVISADTAVAHLAGALARPMWVLLPATPDWRWLRTGDSSPWYPTARLFRQNDACDAVWSWPPVMERVAAALRKRVDAA